MTKPWGYVLRVDPEAIDLRRFERLVAESRPLPARERAAKLASALALWRGTALADLAQEEGLTAEIDRLEELRLVALEERIDADLELGGRRELVQELEALVAAHPLRERLRGQLILALYRSGRQAEALETYRETRRVLVEELGIEPSEELRELERAILRQDPALAIAPLRAEGEKPVLERSRWRWPRSLVGIVAALVLVAAAGVLAAVVMTRGDPSASATTTSVELSSSSGRPTDGDDEPPTETTTKPSPAPEPPPATTDAPQQPVVNPPSPQPEPPVTSRPETTSSTTPTAPKPKPKPKPPTPTPLFDYLLADDFEDTAFDVGMWHLAFNQADAVHAVEQNGRLELSVDPGAVPEEMGFDTHYGTQCEIWGDFDARVDYELLTWPPQNGVSLQLTPWFPQSTTGTHISRVGQPANGGFEAYNSAVLSTASNRTVQTSDTSGALRAKRVGGKLSTYYRYRGHCVLLASAFAPGPLRLLLNVSSWPEGFGRQPAVVAFDNFQATAESVDCAGYPMPPRVRRR